MLRRTLIYAVAALLFLLGMRFATTLQAHQQSQASALPAASVSGSHSARPQPLLAPTLPASDFPDNPVAQHAYATAAKIEPLLNQLPSECSKNQTAQATLLDCFQNRQAAQCRACQREDYYAYKERRAGKSARQIRKGILRGAWKTVQLSRWKRPLPLNIATVG